MAEVRGRLRRGPSVRVSLAIGFLGTIVIILLGIAGPYLKEATTPQSAADPRFVAARSVPAQVISTPAAVTPTTPLPLIDNRGFVNSYARCEGPQTLVALGRTEASAVAICATADGDYLYKGVRLSRGTTLSVGDVSVIPVGFQARNDGVVYTVSAQELVITAGNTVLTREPMVEYQGPR